MRAVFLDRDEEAFPATRSDLASAGHTVVAIHLGGPCVPVVLTTLSQPEEAPDLIVVARSVWQDLDTQDCRRIQLENPTTPILALSGPCEGALRAAALRGGADDFLSMPFELDELLARTEALRRRVVPPSSRARLGDLAVDFIAREVFIEGRLLDLTRREFDLLVALLERAGQVVSRQDLARRLARSGSLGDSNVIDVHMSRLRDKLGGYASQVETVRGLGYRLRATR